MVCPSLDRWRAPVETAFGSLGIPYALEGPVRLAQTPVGHALLGLLRFAWLEAGRSDLFAFLRSPYSGLARSSADFVEGRLRGRAISMPERVEEEVRSLRSASIPPLDALRVAETPVAGVTALVQSMRRARARATTSGRRREERPPCARSLGAADDGARRLGAAHVRASDRGGRRRRARAGRRPAAHGRPRPRPCADAGACANPTARHRLRARPRGGHAAAPRRHVAVPRRRARDRLGGRLLRADSVSRDRYLFYTACSRPTRRLYLVREAATDEGARARRACSGRRSRRSFLPTRSPARRRDARSRS